MGFLDRFRRRQAKEEPSGADEPELLEAPRPPPAPDPGPQAPDTAFAEAMNVDPARLAESAPPLDAEERELAGAIVEHFDAHRPGPASFPGLATKVLELVRDPEVEVPALARLIEDDAALSTGVLVLANSVLFRGVSEVRTVREAIARLGLGEVARIAAALSTRSLYQAGVRAEFAAFAPIWNGLFFHAATVARSASELARVRKLADPDVVFLGGMLHDVGKSLALRSFAALVLERDVKVRDEDTLLRVLDRVHVEVGGVAHQEWGLPRHLGEMAVLHHDAAAPTGPEHAGLNVVRLVSALRLVGARPDLHPGAAGEALQSARALGLGPGRVAALRVAIGEDEQWVRMMFGDGPAA